MRRPKNYRVVLGGAIAALAINSVSQAQALHAPSTFSGAVAAADVAFADRTVTPESNATLTRHLKQTIDSEFPELHGRFVFLNQNLPAAQKLDQALDQLILPSSADRQALQKNYQASYAENQGHDGFATGLQLSDGKVYCIANTSSPSSGLSNLESMQNKLHEFIHCADKMLGHAEGQTHLGLEALAEAVSYKALEMNGSKVDFAISAMAEYSARVADDDDTAKIDIYAGAPHLYDHMGVSRQKAVFDGQITGLRTVFEVGIAARDQVFSPGQQRAFTGMHTAIQRARKLGGLDKDPVADARWKQRLGQLPELYNPMVGKAQRDSHAQIDYKPYSISPIAYRSSIKLILQAQAEDPASIATQSLTQAYLSIGMKIDPVFVKQNQAKLFQAMNAVQNYTQPATVPNKSSALISRVLKPVP